MTNSRQNPSLRAFVRGAWLVLTVQFLVALIVFTALGYGAVRLSNILGQLHSKQEELHTKQEQVAALNARIRAFEASMPFIRGGIVAFQDGLPFFDGRSDPEDNPALALSSFRIAVASYDQALKLDPENAYTLDLKSYAQYYVGLAARSADPGAAQASIEAAAGTMREGLRLDPQSLNGYFQLAIYLCQLDRFDEAVAAYDDAIARRGVEIVVQEFSAREGEIVRRCEPLRQRFRRAP